MAAWVELLFHRRDRARLGWCPTLEPHTGKREPPATTIDVITRALALAAIRETRIAFRAVCRMEHEVRFDVHGRALAFSILPTDYARGGENMICRRVRRL